MVKTSKRMQDPEFLHEMRLIYKLENWMSMMININVIFAKVIFPSGAPLIQGIKEANTAIGTRFSEEIKRAYLQTINMKEEGGPSLVEVYD